MNLPEPGETFERYQVESLLGEGGFAVVFGATDGAGRRVAIKVLKPDHGDGYDAQTRARFTRETELVARLRSPHTVRLLDTGASTGGLLYAVFEHVPGRDLGEVLEQVGPHEPESVRHILRQLLDALAEAHESGLLHRDIKPDNIRVFATADDRMAVKLLDFGIARATDDSHPSITKTGELIGTPRYMSPEQLTSAPLGPASDLYSLGLVAFELLLGREALHGNRWGDQLLRLQSDHVFVVADADRVGEALLATIQRMTARDPAKRFQTARAVSASLEAIDGTTALAAMSGRPRPEPTRWRPFAVGLGLLALCGAVYAVLGTAPTTKRPPVPRRAVAGLFKVDMVDAATSLVSDGLDAAAADAGHDAAALDSGAGETIRGTAGCGSDRSSELAQIPDMVTWVPENYSPKRPYPVVILMHQDEVRPEELLRGSDFWSVADREGFVVLAPSDRGMLGFSSWKDDLEDPGKVKALLDAAGEVVCLDPRRVYVAADGNAGRVAYYMSCEPWVTALAVHAYSVGEAYNHCSLAKPKPKPLLLTTPRSSPHVPVDGGQGCYGAGRIKISMAELENKWKVRNHCRSKRRSIAHEPTFECFEWTCEAALRSCYMDGGHGWPGMPPRVLTDDGNCSGPASATFPLAQYMWDFFKGTEPLPDGPE